MQPAQRDCLNDWLFFRWMFVIVKLWEIVILCFKKNVLELQAFTNMPV